MHYCTTLMCHCEEANGRRGALSAKREEVPLGCNLGKALPSRTSRRFVVPAIVGEGHAPPGTAQTIRTGYR